MKFSNIFEKLGILFNLVIDSKILIILMLLIGAVLILRLKNKIGNKKLWISIYLIELLILGVTFYTGKDFLMKLVNTLIDNIFLNFYFPSIYVYLFIFVMSFVIFIYTLLNRFISKTYKIITNIYFVTFNFIFILLLNVISKNNIDIFEKASLFTNNDSLVLLELTTSLFLIYLVVISLIYFTNWLIVKVGDKKLSTGKYSHELELINPAVVEGSAEEEQADYSPNVSISFQELVKSTEQNENVTKIDLVPELKNYKATGLDLLKNVELIPAVNNEFKYIDQTLLKEPFGDDVIKANKKEDVKEKLNFIDFNILEKKKEEKLTLNDYKLFSNMLKTVIQNNNSSNLSLTDILNKNLLSKYSFEEYSKFEKILNSCLN